MRHGYFDFINISHFPYLLIGLIIAIILLVIVLRESSIKNREINRFRGIIEKRLNDGEIGIEEYDELNAILENENSVEPALMVIKERYAYGDLNLEEYLKMRDNVKLMNSNYKLSSSLKLKYAMGEINDQSH